MLPPMSVVCRNEETWWFTQLKNQIIRVFTIFYVSRMAPPRLINLPPQTTPLTMTEKQKSRSYLWSSCWLRSGQDTVFIANHWHNFCITMENTFISTQDHSVQGAQNNSVGCSTEWNEIRCEVPNRDKLTKSHYMHGPHDLSNGQ